MAEQEEKKQTTASTADAAAADEIVTATATTAAGVAVTGAAVGAAPVVEDASLEKKPEETEEDGEDVITLSEAIKQQEVLTEAADAVLGDCSDTNCSYPMSYIRQAVYACVTCTPDALEKPETRAGICLACSYNCHQDHELVELYTKRAFRCDCGNAKFPTNNPCKLEADKAPTNPRNVYSQNYGGRYCSCHRPYPDPERTTAEVMVQCVICEDWLHDEHLFPASPSPDAVEATSAATATSESEEDFTCAAPAAVSTLEAATAAAAAESSVASAKDFDELVCLDCMKKHPFLLAYTVENPISADTEAEGDTEHAEGTGHKASEAEVQPEECVLKPKQKQLEDESKTALRPTFWPSEWREGLCRCSACVALFEKHGIEFLLDPEDALHAYEANAREKKTALDEERAQQAFANSLSHEQQVEVAIGYNHMKTNLQEFLAGYASTGKTVRPEDIQSFFEGLKQSKRQKTEP